MWEVVFGAPKGEGLPRGMAPKSEGPEERGPRRVGAPKGGA